MKRLLIPALLGLSVTQGQADTLCYFIVNAEGEVTSYKEPPYDLSYPQSGPLSAEDQAKRRQGHLVIGYTSGSCGTAEEILIQRDDSLSAALAAAGAKIGRAKEEEAATTPPAGETPPASAPPETKPEPPPPAAMAPPVIAPPPLAPTTPPPAATAPPVTEPAPAAAPPAAAESPPVATEKPGSITAPVIRNIIRLFDEGIKQKNLQAAEKYLGASLDLSVTSGQDKKTETVSAQDFIARIVDQWQNNAHYSWYHTNINISIDSSGKNATARADLLVDIKPKDGSADQMLEYQENISFNLVDGQTQISKIARVLKGLPF